MRMPLFYTPFSIRRALRSNLFAVDSAKKQLGREHRFHDSTLLDSSSVQSSFFLHNIRVHITRVMSDPINANPTIIDVSSLPTRLDTLSKEKDAKRELVDRILSLSLYPQINSVAPPDEVPELISEGELSATSDEELDFDEDDEDEEIIDAQEIFDLIATISDPEHPLTLAQLAVVNLSDITVTHGTDKKRDISEVLIKITPTITHCSLATLIGLGIRVRLERLLPPRFRIRILIKEGTHQSENQVNKQLNDKERVAAACENDQLLSVILQMLSTCK
ncbi:hypothetical protein METBIDRAFT_229914 [Metschnikowia bicuspidata var. bicuspidata NRRL YB-4993]|uniref:Uncharacterized protein n=1 Tax=Metschnikowia bicuspidata var. bicuspidata NRRL YB-4993 TaxID=869754 RepID=A0A1A0HCI6_9ASCO|nr:hypothetical protein METBIDRAFT_229914 [Metschnikowia bicuspidata var. bicuspidata NRRL YB-4993]OBA21705.1 hypothetical protein METBIDRAFT_229914 [Metschnikowia bicuspidata var. bicuspidata NRRL YB-4993]